MGGWNFLAEIFAPYTAADYRGLFVGEASGRSATAAAWLCFMLLSVAGMLAFTHSSKMASLAALALLFVPLVVDAAGHLWGFWLQYSAKKVASWIAVDRSPLLKA